MKAGTKKTDLHRTKTGTLKMSPPDNSEELEKYEELLSLLRTELIAKHITCLDRLITKEIKVAFRRVNAKISMIYSSDDSSRGVSRNEY